MILMQVVKPGNNLLKLSFKLSSGCGFFITQVVGMLSMGYSATCNCLLNVFFISWIEFIACCYFVRYSEWDTSNILLHSMSVEFMLA